MFSLSSILKAPCTATSSPYLLSFPSKEKFFLTHQNYSKPTTTILNINEKQSDNTLRYIIGDKGEFYYAYVDD